MKTFNAKASSSPQAPNMKSRYAYAEIRRDERREQAQAEEHMKNQLLIWATGHMEPGKAYRVELKRAEYLTDPAMPYYYKIRQLITLEEIT